MDDQLKAQSSDALAVVGLTLLDAVRILLTRVATKGGNRTFAALSTKVCNADLAAITQGLVSE